MRLGHGNQPFLAAAAFGGLLATAGCPVRLVVEHTSVGNPAFGPPSSAESCAAAVNHVSNNLQVARIFNAVSCEAFLQLVMRALVRGTGSGSTEEGKDGDPMDVEAGEAADGDAEGSRLQLCTDALTGFTAVLKAHGLANELDMLRR